MAWRYIALGGAIAVLGTLLVGGSPGMASQPFSPSLAIDPPSSTLPGANASITLSTTVPAGHALFSVNVILPPEWGVASDNQVPDGDVVGSAVIEADVGCDSIADAPFTWTLEDFPAASRVHAEWRATGSWGWRVVVDELMTGEIELSIVLGNGSMPTPICAPQTFTLTINGLSSPSSSAVLTNPSPVANYVWSAIFVSAGLEHVTSDSDTVAIGPDSDGDQIADVGDNCPSVPNTGQLDGDGDGAGDVCDNCPSLPNPGQGDANTNGVGDACDPADSDGDGFSDILEFLAGTDPGDDCPDDPSDAAWAVDFNNDTFVNSADLSSVASVIGQSVPPAPARNDIDPDPPDQTINSGDLSQVAARIGQGCTP